jgi:glucosamine--fructose-6-phosphate aminotransferase (isomerizing)
MAQEKGAFVYGICNVVGASIPRATDTGTYTHAGPEIGVASTKAFTTQITVLLMMALRLGRLRKTLTDKRYRSLLHGLYQVPEQIETMLENAPKIEKIAHRYNQSPNCLYLGRGYNFPVALEGALKLKEISYIHAEGYPSAEMKHGPIALIDEHMPVVVIATKKNHYEKVLSNIQEIKSRKGKIIAVVSEGDVQVKALADHLIEIPACEEALTPLLASIPLQLLAYYIALQRGCDVDQPRNLAKSVTVE